MAVQISKKRKVRPWAWDPGDCSAVGVRAFSKCCRGTRSSCPGPGSGVGCEAPPRAADGGGLSAGPEPGERSVAGKGRRFLRGPGGEQTGALGCSPAPERALVSIYFLVNTPDERTCDILRECEPGRSLQVLTPWLWEGVLGAAF